MTKTKGSEAGNGDTFVAPQRQNRISVQREKARDSSQLIERLSIDMKKLQALEAEYFPEAVALYCGRCLEQVINAIGTRLNLSSTQPNLFSLITCLERYDLMSLDQRYYIHGLRRLTNEARHANRTLDVFDANLAKCFLKQSLKWAIDSFKFLSPHRIDLQDQLQSISHLFDSVPDYLATFPSANQMRSQSLIGTETGVLRSSYLLAVLAEKAIHLKLHDLARDILKKGVAKHGERSRLVMLLALVEKRDGNLHAALELLKPLHNRLRNDIEFLGILGGIQKAIWIESADRVALESSIRTYHSGWNQSNRSDEYLGVNVATLNACCGDMDKASEVARIVIDLIAVRRVDAARIKTECGRDYVSSFWVAATLAEAEFVRGNSVRAQYLYRGLLSQRSQNAGAFEVCQRQWGLIARLRGIVSDFDTWVKGSLTRERNVG